MRKPNRSAMSGRLDALEARMAKRYDVPHEDIDCLLDLLGFQKPTTIQQAIAEHGDNHPEHRIKDAYRACRLFEPETFISDDADFPPTQLEARKIR